MFKNIVSSLLIICLIFTLNSCCTLIGYGVGKSLDNKSKEEVYNSQTDSSVVTTETLQSEEIKTNEKNYTALLTILGIVVDVSLVFVGLLLSNPIKINLGGGIK